MTDSRELHIERVFDAPRPLVFANWVEAEHIGAWFAPAGFEVVEAFFEARPGGRWRVAYRAPSGELYVEHGDVIAVTAPESLHFTLINQGPQGAAAFRSEVRVLFHERASKTTVILHQTGFDSTELRDAIGEGWGSCFDKLERQLAAERDLRSLFEEWFRASERKDLDACMAPLAPDVLSYEHETPLVHRGVDALRASCKVGFDKAPEPFRWDIPELRVMVRGDVAVTWGLNHMRGPGLEMWSRGTRIFQRIDGRWRMIHQHVSFPYDPESGAAKMDLHPG
jgi:uncharacterized protein YndB with AHSA1/START domain